MLKLAILTCLAGFAVVVIRWLLKVWSQLKINIEKAETMGLRYVVTRK